MLRSLEESLIYDNSFPYVPYVTYVVVHYLYLDYRNISVSLKTLYFLGNMKQ